MQIAETVTFGGSALDRSASLRRDDAGLAKALATGAVLPIWRGKPLMAGERPAWVAAGHPVLALAGPPVFLGIDDGVPRFAADLSDWSPEAGADALELGFIDQTVQQHPAMTAGEGFVELRGVMSLLTPRDAELVVTAKAILQWHRSHGFCSTCGAKSDMAQGGWQRSCSACKAQHFPRTDPVVIMLVTSGNSVLLGRSPGWPEGMFSLLAGFVEPGETVEAAVRREFGNTVPVAFPGYNVTYAGTDGGRSLFLAQVWFANPDGVRAIRLQAWTKVGDFLMSVPANSPVTEVRQTRIGGLDVLSLLPTAAVAGGIGPRTIYLTNGATIWVVELDGFTDNAEALQVAATLAGIVTTPNPPATGNSDSGDAAGLGRITPGAALAVLAVSALLGRLLWAATGSRRRLTTNARD